MLKPIPLLNDYIPEVDVLNYGEGLPIQTLTYKNKVTNMTIPDITTKVIIPWEAKEKPPENYGEDACTIGSKTLKVISFYVDSVSIHNLTPELFNQGDGSKDNPFKCLSYALPCIFCMYHNIIKNMCDIYIVINVYGVLDYFDFDTVKKFPQFSDFIATYDFDAIDDFHSRLIYNFDGCHSNLYAGNHTDSLWNSTIDSYACIKFDGVISCLCSTTLFKTNMLINSQVIIQDNSNNKMSEIRVGFFDSETIVYNTLLSVNGYEIFTNACCFIECTIYGDVKRFDCGSYFSDDLLKPCLYGSKINVTCFNIGIRGVSYNCECIAKADYCDWFHAYKCHLTAVPCNYDNVQEDDTYPTVRCDVSGSINSIFSITDGDYSEISFINNVVCNISMGNTNKKYARYIFNSESTDNSILNMEIHTPIIIPPDPEDDSYYQSDLGCLFMRGVHRNSTFNIKASWSGGDMKATPNLDCLGAYSCVLENCTSTCEYSLPSIFHHFECRGLYYRDNFSIIGGNIFKGVCVDGAGSLKDYNECMKQCQDQGHTDCETRCITNCEDFNNRWLN